MTHGLSPKAVLAFLYPAVATTLTALILWLATGTFDTDELRLSLAGYLASTLAALGAWLGQPGNITQTIGPPSDQMLAQRASFPLSRAEVAKLTAATS